MSDRWSRRGRTVSEHPARVLIAIAVVTVLLGAGLTRLDFATGQDSYLDPSTDTAEANHRYQELFGGEAMIVMFSARDGSTIADLFSPANRSNFEVARRQIEAAGDLTFSTLTPTALLQWSSDLVTSGIATEVLGRAVGREASDEARAARASDAQITLARALGAGSQTLDNPDWTRFLLYSNEGWSLDGTALAAPPDDELTVRRSLEAFVPDDQHAVMAVVLKGNATLDEQAAGAELVERVVGGLVWENVDVVVTGTPTFLTEINDYLQGGMLSLGLVAVVVMLVVLAVTFRIRWRFLPLATVLIGIVWGFGAFAFTGTDLSLVTISGLPILIGLGMDFAIQIHSRSQEECTNERVGSPLEETLARLGPPLALATAVAVASFLVMRISRVPMIRDFGVLLAIGIVALVLAALTMTVAILTIRERRSPSSEPLHPGLGERVVVGLGALPPVAVVPLLVLAVIVPIVGLRFESQARIESDPINWANQESRTILDARELERQTGFATTLGVFVETNGFAENGIFTDEMASFVHGFELGAVADEGTLLPAGSSAVSVLSYLLDVPGATPLPPTGLDVLQAMSAAPDAVRRLLVSDDGNAMQVQFNVGPSSLEARADLIARMEDRIAVPPGGATAIPAGSDATPAGLARVGVSLLGNLTAGRTAFAVVALLLAAGLMFLRFRNLALAGIAMVPVLVAVGAADILVHLLDITLSPLTTVGAPLVVALCAEFSILIVSRYVEERERGLEPRAAIDHTSARTGRAFTASALATIGGFGVLVFSSLPLLSDFGLIVMLKVAVALGSALVVVPPVIVWADERNLLGLSPSGSPARIPSWLPASVGVALLAAAVGFGVTEASGEAATVTAAIRTVPAAAAPATFPPSTTVAPTTTLAPDASTTTLPPGPAEAPTGLVASAVYGAFVAAGAEPGIARCTVDALLATTPEAELLAAGIASVPPSEQATALVAAAAVACGVPAEIQAAVQAENG